ncbi:hypothetical protein B0F90DRAFT_1633040 [Multifurca ochricompacta]|uniref:Glycoside hydrolase 131 catalytic N-terminal domain-containing protein n=1 Tax=Multifurca ochricompacta TaxID=376703 RepID=A0AAD4M175_9AGAM|nr:hypothetical protein B0F90DRAFT_1633040 [Multifurca ochricompacta]
MLFSTIAFALLFDALVWATPVLWEGRAPYNYTKADIDESIGPYFSAVKGTHNASNYFQFLGHALLTTPIWPVPEQAIRTVIDNSSIFTPGSSAPQLGFRRSEIIAQPSESGNRTAFDAILESGVTAFHFSLKTDKALPLNYSHEYQGVWIEPNDGSHIFDLQITSKLVRTPATHVLGIRAHNGTVLFQTPFHSTEWHNFAVVVDWDNLTLKVFYSLGARPLKAVTNVEENSSAVKGPNGQGEFHFGVLKLPLVDPSETPAEQADVVHFGIQEGSCEALIYSGIFVESTQDGISIGYGNTMSV